MAKSRFSVFWGLKGKLDKITLKHDYTITYKELIKEVAKDKGSLKTLTPMEYSELCRVTRQRISNLQPKDRGGRQTGKTQANNNWENSPENKMRRKIISLFRLMGYTADAVDAVKGWAKTKGYLKKELNSYTANELPELVSQAEIMYQKHLTEVHKPSF